jgi:hypothetical protein
MRNLLGADTVNDLRLVVCPPILVRCPQNIDLLERKSCVR